MISVTTIPAEARKTIQRAMLCDPDMDMSLAEALWEDPDRVIDDGESLKDKVGDRCSVVRVERNGERYVVKRYNSRGWMHTARHLVLRSRARWCWVNGHRLRSIGLLTPRPRAVLEDRCGPFRTRSYFVMDYVEGPTLLDEIRAGRVSRDRLDRFAEAFEGIWSALGENRIGHRDMKASNFIVDAEDQLWMVDLDGMRTHHLATSFSRRRVKDRNRFLRNWRDLPEVEAIFRARVDSDALPAG